MPLFEPGRHEALTRTAWSEERATAALSRIVADTNAAFTADGLWPIHPSDRSPERPPDCLKMLYNGAAGVIWALHRLDELGVAPLVHDFLPVVRTLAERHRRDVETHGGVRDYIGHERDAFLIGETGLHLLECKLARSGEVEKRLAAAIEAKIGDNRGIVWGGAGAMLAALFRLDRTGEARWRDLYLRHFEAFWSEWEFSSELRCHLWTIDLYGIAEKRLGALLGFLANAAPMLRGRHLLDAERERELLRRIRETLVATAISEGGQRNWPNSAEALKGTEHPPLFVQYCNGPAGVIAALSAFQTGIDPQMDALLLQAGELVWQAGPLVKYPCLCHGTPGNGYALLALYARTGDAAWLMRARRFAMHAIEQSEAQLAASGQRKFSLWTGDLGLALYLADCVRMTASFPALDVF